MTTMYCPVCGEKLGRHEHHEGEDEGSGDALMPYAYWLCDACGTQVHDWDDDYEPPENAGDALQSAGEKS